MGYTDPPGPAPFPSFREHRARWPRPVLGRDTRRGAGRRWRDNRCAGHDGPRARRHHDPRGAPPGTPTPVTCDPVPVPGPPVGEPDYRMSLAAERTLPGLHPHLARAQRRRGGRRRTARRRSRHPAPRGGGAGRLATAASVRLRWRQVDAAMRAGRPLPSGLVGTVLTAGVVVAGALVLVLVLRL